MCLHFYAIIVVHAYDITFSTARSSATIAESITDIAHIGVGGPPRSTLLPRPERQMVTTALPHLLFRVLVPITYQNNSISTEKRDSVTANLEERFNRATTEAKLQKSLHCAVHITNHPFLEKVIGITIYGDYATRFYDCSKRHSYALFNDLVPKGYLHKVAPDQNKVSAYLPSESLLTIDHPGKSPISWCVFAKDGCAAASVTTCGKEVTVYRAVLKNSLLNSKEKLEHGYAESAIGGNQNDTTPICINQDFRDSKSVHPLSVEYQYHFSVLPESAVTCLSLLHFPVSIDAQLFRRFALNGYALLTGHCNGFLNVWWCGNIDKQHSDQFVPTPTDLPSSSSLVIPYACTVPLASYPPFHANRGPISSISPPFATGGTRARFSKSIHPLSSLSNSTVGDIVDPSKGSNRSYINSVLDACTTGRKLSKCSAAIPFKQFPSNTLLHSLDPTRQDQTSTSVCVGAHNTRGWRLFAFAHTQEDAVRCSSGMSSESVINTGRPSSNNIKSRPNLHASQTTIRPQSATSRLRNQARQTNGNSTFTDSLLLCPDEPELLQFAYDQNGKRNLVPPPPMSVGHLLNPPFVCPSYADVLRAPIIGLDDTLCVEGTTVDRPMRLGPQDQQLLSVLSDVEEVIKPGAHHSDDSTLRMNPYFQTGVALVQLYPSAEQMVLESLTSRHPLLIRKQLQACQEHRAELWRKTESERLRGITRHMRINSDIPKKDRIPPATKHAKTNTTVLDKCYGATALQRKLRPKELADDAASPPIITPNALTSEAKDATGKNSSRASNLPIDYELRHMMYNLPFAKMLAQSVWNGDKRDRVLRSGSSLSSPSSLVLSKSAFTILSRDSRAPTFLHPCLRAPTTPRTQLNGLVINENLHATKEGPIEAAIIHENQSADGYNKRFLHVPLSVLFFLDTESVHTAGFDFHTAIVAPTKEKDVFIDNL